MIKFTGERIVPEAENCEPLFARKMYQEHLARYAFAAQWIHGKRVLDVGCGVGYGAQWLAVNGASSVLAFDLSPGAIQHANEHYSHPNVSFQVASATNFDFDQKFDIVTCFELIEHVEEQQQVIACIRRAMKDDGILIISTPRALEKKRTDFHTKEFSEQEFRELLHTNFSNTKFYFENNHFASLITDRRPDSINQVIPLEDQFSLAEADYFIAVATPSSANLNIGSTSPVMTLNNDRYVLLLERDIEILRKAENAFLAERDGFINQNKIETAAANLQIDRLNRLNLELTRKSEVIESEAVKARLERDIAQSKNAELMAVFGAEKAKLHEQKEAVTREREYFADLAHQIQNSFSWKLTKPYRVVGGLAKKASRLSRRALSYQRANGTKALITASYRRLRRDTLQISTIPDGIPVIDLGRSGDSEDFDVIFAIGCWEGESKRYRVHNIAEGLLSIGYKVSVISFEKIGSLATKNVHSRTVVLFRAADDGSGDVYHFLRYAKNNKIKVVYDTDDLVFDPEILDQIHGFQCLPESEKSQYVAGVEGYRKLLLEADIVTVPTVFLSQQVAALGKVCHVIPNSLNRLQLKIAHELRQAGSLNRQTQEVVIGYFSGSKTHQNDFAECAEALFEVMTRHVHVRLMIVGHLDLEDRWAIFSSRIERIGFLPYQEMLVTLSKVDINLAPLELASVFCQGKSELKFFEAGALGIPTVASKTDTFARAIINRETGLLADNSYQWLAALEELVGSSAMRKEIGEKARQVALEKYSPLTVTASAANAYGLDSKSDDPEARTLLSATGGGRQRIAWVVPGLIIGGGGHRNILRAAYFLSKFGHHISLYFTDINEDPETIRKLIHEHFYPINCPIYLFNGSIKPVDVVFATHWTTVAPALTAKNVAKEIMYFVQDFEPAFAPMSSEYVLAENTYRLGLYHITSGPWCEVVLKRDFHAAADHFQFPVDRSIYYPRNRTKTNKNIIFFAKPEMPRRCFELGIMALSELHRLCPSVEIIMFGSKNAAKRSYEFPATIRELVPTLDDLAEMYSNGDVGLCFSTTNPSLIPYEMMACGLPVVDLERGDNSVNYDDRNDIALLADPLPEKMAVQIMALLNNESELANRRANGLTFIDKFPSEEGMAKRIETLILNRLENIEESNQPSETSVSQEAIAAVNS